MVYYIELYLRRQFMNINLYYQEKGKGEVLVLLHGNSDNSNYFVNQIEYF